MFWSPIKIAGFQNVPLGCAKKMAKKKGKRNSKGSRPNLHITIVVKLVLSMIGRVWLVPYYENIKDSEEKNLMIGGNKTDFLKNPI